MDSAYRVGCDIGGTFTDFVLIDTATGRIHTAKRLTTPADPSIGMLAGLRDLAEAAPGYTSSTERLAHANCSARQHAGQGKYVPRCTWFIASAVTNVVIATASFGS